jgi:small subunit ribosomal protein S9
MAETKTRSKPAKHDRADKDDELSGLSIDIPTGPIAKPAAPAPAKVPAAPKPARGGWWWGTGRRKRAVARIRMKPATGDKAIVNITISSNKTKTLEQYFPEERDRLDALAPLRVTNAVGRFEIHARLDGGGLMGQAQAFRMGLSRALRDYDPASFEQALRDNGFLTRDSREVERKKYGQAGARRRFQFSKR